MILLQRTFGSRIACLQGILVCSVVSDYNCLRVMKLGRICNFSPFIKLDKDLSLNILIIQALWTLCIKVLNHTYLLWKKFKLSFSL